MRSKAEMAEFVAQQTGQKKRRGAGGRGVGPLRRGPDSTAASAAAQARELLEEADGAMELFLESFFCRCGAFLVLIVCLSCMRCC